jgi:hypothetical protein
VYVLEDYSKASILSRFVSVEFCIFFINALTVVVYIGLSVGCTQTFSLYSVFMRYFKIRAILLQAK